MHNVLKGMENHIRDFFSFQVIGVQKVQKDAQKIEFSSEVVKFAGKIRIDMIIIFNIYSFFFCDRVNLSKLRYIQFQ